jgi:outer membrane beta-barrel protein
MESRIRGIFLSSLALVASAILALPALAQDDSVPAEQQTPRVIEPDVQRRSVDVSKIDTEDFEITGFVGMMGIEDFEADLVIGARLAYHINDLFFAEASYGSSEAGRSSFEKLQLDADLLGSNRDFSYYDLSLGYNVLPGEVFFGSKRAFNSSMYLIGGLGSTDFADDNNFTINFGFGIKFLPTDYIAIRLDARDYLFDTEITGEDKTTHNFQGTLNVSWYF